MITLSTTLEMKHKFLTGLLLLFCIHSAIFVMSGLTSASFHSSQNLPWTSELFTRCVSAGRHPSSISLNTRTFNYISLNLSLNLSILSRKKVANSSLTSAGVPAGSIGLSSLFHSRLFTSLNNFLESFCAEFPRLTRLTLLLKFSIIMYLFLSLVKA